MVEVPEFEGSDKKKKWCKIRGSTVLRRKSWAMMDAEGEAVAASI
jgi:hypothetical protein